MHAATRGMISIALMMLTTAAIAWAEDAKTPAKPAAEEPAAEPAKEPASDSPADAAKKPDSEPAMEPADQAATEEEADAKKDAEMARKYLSKAKISITAAIKAASAKLPKGKPLEAYFQADDSEMVFVVEMIVATKHQPVYVDAVSGEVLGVGEEVEVEKEDATFEASIIKTATTLSTAIDAAGKQVPAGKAYDAYIDRVEEEAVISVVILSVDKIIGAVIDPKTNKALSVAPVEE